MEEIKTNKKESDLHKIMRVKTQDEEPIKPEEVVIDIKDNKPQFSYHSTNNYYKDQPLCKMEFK